MLDAGGVVLPDSHIGAYNQEELEILTGLTAIELNAFQDHASLNLGSKTLTDTFDLIAQNSRTEPKPTTEALLSAYRRGVAFYPGAIEMIRTLYSTGYQVCLLTNNSHEGIAHVRDLLRAEKLSCVTVYGSAEMGLSKPNRSIFLKACELEKVNPAECWFVDDRAENCRVAEELGMSVVAVTRPETLSESAKTVGACRDAFLKCGIFRENEVTFPVNFNRGMYPSLFGLMNGNVVRYEPDDNPVEALRRHQFHIVDQPNADGNQQKRCLYESRLAQLIVELGSVYWKSAYQKINQLFLADFDRKNNASHGDTYNNYFSQIEKTLKKEGVLSDKEKTHTALELREALTTLYSRVPFELTTISQFYYGVWLVDYGHQPLEPFVFVCDHTPALNREQILILTICLDMAHNVQSRENAYLLAQNWLTCGTPQLRGRKARIDAPKPPHSSTIGIMRDEDVVDDTLRSPPHYAAKVGFSPSREHPITQTFESMGAPIIGGSSGTLGRNIFMLAPLVENGLLTQQELMQYVMGFVADLIYRGHHSFEEVAHVADKILFPLKPWLDPIRDPIAFYEQLLTPEFIASREYQTFKSANEHFFDTPIRPGLR